MSNIDNMVPTPRELDSQRWERVYTYLIDELAKAQAPKCIFVSRLVLCTKAAWISAADFQKVASAFRKKGWTVTIDKNPEEYMRMISIKAPKGEETEG